MSRSYKKTPVCKDGNDSKKSGKKIANKKVRKNPELRGKSNLFKKAYESWNICDFRLYEECEKDFDTKALNFWKKWYLRK